MDCARQSSAGKEILNLADADNRVSGGLERVQQGRMERLERKIAAVRRALEMSGLPYERPGNDAADTHSPSNDVERDAAHPVELVDGNHGFMRRDLEDGVRRGVDDRRASPHVFRTERVDDGGARCDGVADRRAADPGFELTDDFRRKPSRKGREGMLEHDAHHFPVAGDGVLSRRGLRHSAERAARGDRRPANRRDLAPGPATAASAREALPREQCCQACRCPRHRTAEASGSSPAPTESITMRTTRSMGE